MELDSLVLIIVFVVGIVVLKNLFSRKSSLTKQKQKTVYRYLRKQYLMTKSESDFYRVLKEVVTSEYDVFAQVHLSSIVDHRVKGQNWNAAFRTINQKSVDFVLCDRPNSKPVLAIELDDWSHEKQDRKIRDEFVENVLQEVGLPLLRINNWRALSSEDLRLKIFSTIPSPKD